MAGFAYVSGVDMPCWQTMTTGTRAGAKDFIVIHRQWWDPGCRHMAGFAYVSGVDMPCWQTMTTGTRAGAQDFIVINC